MGTRADFYVGLGPEAEWLGSTAFDGYPQGVFVHTNDSLPIDSEDLPDQPTTETQWRMAVMRRLANRDDATKPTDGWPWPWDDSATTDFAYTYDTETGRVLGSCFAGPWFVVADGVPKDEDDEEDPSIDRDGIGTPTFPDMSSRKNVRHDRGSGAIFISQRPDGGFEVSG